MNSTSGKKSLAMKAYEHILKSIFEQEIEHGARLTEAEIAQKLGMSNGPVREAIHTLEGEGWLRCIPNRGTYCVNFHNPKEIRKVFQMRRVIEVGAAYEIALQRTTEMLSKMENAVTEIDSALQKRDVLSYRHSDMKFHQTMIYLVCGNQLCNYFDHIHLQTALIGTLTPRDEGYLDSTVDLICSKYSHHAIFSAIHSGDGSKTAALVDGHVEFAEKDCYAAIGKIRIESAGLGDES